MMFNLYMKKIFAFILLMFCFAFPVQNAYAIDEVSSLSYVVVANKASIFSSPDFNSAKSEITLSHNEKIEVQVENGKAKVYTSPDGEYSFYKIVDKPDFSYVFADLLSQESAVITSVPNYNGKTNDTCKVFLSEDNSLVESDISLEKNQRIFIYEGFNSKAQYTKICFLHNNQVVYGQIETKFVSPDGINPIIITCAIVILAVLGIIFAWLFMKNRKVKIKSKTKQEK